MNGINRKPAKTVSVCEICEVTPIASKLDTVCRACDLQMIRDQAASDALALDRAPRRHCDGCNVLLPAHRYFECEKCDPTCLRPSESDFDGFDDMNVGDEGGDCELY